MGGGVSRGIHPEPAVEEVGVREQVPAATFCGGFGGIAVRRPAGRRGWGAREMSGASAEDDATICRAAIREAMGSDGKPTRAKLKLLFRNLTFEQIARRRGWPGESRAEMWLLTSGAHEKMMERPEYYQSLIQESSRPDETVRQEIERDLGRTLPGADGPHGEGDYFSSRVGEDALRNILSAYASHNPTVGYCQGMNFLAATLLLEIKDEEKSFWVLSVLVERILVQYYHNSLVGLRIDQEVLGDYVRQYLPRIHAHFARHQFDLAFASTSWLLCIFINSLPMSAVMHVVDLLLYDGSAIIVRACLGLLSILQQRILECDSQEDILTMMKPKGGYLTAGDDGTEIDGQLLMKVTFLNFPQLKDIDSKRAHHRASRKIAAMEPAPFKPAGPATSLRPRS